MLKINRVTIDGFWGTKKFDMLFDNDVNILAGINGSGKTTMLNIIYSILINMPNRPLCSHKYSDATIELSGGYKVVCSTIEDEKKVSYFLREQEIPYEEFTKQILVHAVSTFDSTSYSIEYKSKLKERYPWVDSDLDYQLANSLFDYQKYQANISNQVENLLGNTNVDVIQLREHFDLIERTRSTCDAFFAPNLHWDRQHSEVQFLLENNKTVIYPKDLSTGEKQLLIILISTMIEEEKECIVFWDEPEISLHIDWQHQLISRMQIVNPQMQLIIATHSPAMIYDGWENRVLNMSKLFIDE